MCKNSRDVSNGQNAETHLWSSSTKGSESSSSPSESTSGIICERGKVCEGRQQGDPLARGAQQ